jgi:hypothetical protein
VSHRFPTRSATAPLALLFKARQEITMTSKKESEIRINSRSSEKEVSTRQQFYGLFADCPIPSSEMLANLGLFINRQAWSRFLFMHDLYKTIIPINGIVVEFGVRWGQNLALFSSFRAYTNRSTMVARLSGSTPLQDSRKSLSKTARIAAPPQVLMALHRISRLP